jgi:uncharacterized protein YbdZ (MbtH family)
MIDARSLSLMRPTHLDNLEIEVLAMEFNQYRLWPTALALDIM